MLDVIVKEKESQAKIENMADKQSLDEEKVKIDAQVKADKQALDEAMFEVEAQSPDVNIFQRI